MSDDDNIIYFKDSAEKVKKKRGKTDEDVRARVRKESHQHRVITNEINILNAGILQAACFDMAEKGMSDELISAAIMSGAISGIEH